MRQGEDHVEVGHRQQRRLLGVDPLRLLASLTLRTVAIAAGVICNAALSALIAFFDVPTQRVSTAPPDRSQHGSLIARSCVGLEILGPIVVHDIGELDLNISGCMNACGHHHVGHIGILGVDKNGEEWYQISIGGRQGVDAALGKVIGKSVARAEVPDVIESLIEAYLDRRESDNERFVDVVHRLGIEPFKERVYGH